MTKRKKELLRKRVFEKVVEYQYPNGDKYNGNIIGFFLISLVFYICHIISSPFTFKKSIYCGKRKVYFKEIN